MWGSVVGELVNSSLSKGPQLVTRHGRPAVVVIPVSEYEQSQSPAGGAWAYAAGH
ncbi:MAG: type II toxin-antitoxin system prevent-host-death family antitoxin [Spirochaetaceae bacterium]|nr:MAG: type II toxin-antitoxin system prevent-host-death family antitoxin [Spirochaetaceae bacterium]